MDQARSDCRDDLGDVGFDRGLRTRRAGLVYPHALEPALSLVGRAARVPREIGLLPDDAVDDEDKDEDSQREQCDETDRCGGSARHVPGKPRDDRHDNGRDDQRAHNQARDRVRRTEQPDHAGDQSKDPDQKPRRASEVLQPARRRERRRESTQSFGIDLNAALAVRQWVGVGLGLPLFVSHEAHTALSRLGCRARDRRASSHRAYGRSSGRHGSDPSSGKGDEADRLDATARVQGPSLAHTSFAARSSPEAGVGADGSFRRSPHPFIAAYTACRRRWPPYTDKA